MRIEIVPTVEEIRQEHIVNRAVIIIDVLRASSTIVTAFAEGCEEIFPVETAGQAFALKNNQIILVGERHCKKIPEFDYNNSPTALIKADLCGKKLVLTTTNGTRAIHKAERAAVVYIGCFANAASCIKKALSHQLELTLYCAGTRQEFALEDGLAAGYMIHCARQIRPDINVCDLGVVLEASFLHLQDRLAHMLYQSTTGKRLIQHQCVSDVQHCSQLNLYQIVPVVKEKRILPVLVS